MPEIHKSASHWVPALILLVVGLLVGENLNENDAWIKLRYRTYSLQNLSPHQTYPKRTALVMIGDQEYWRGELARRIPIKRSYLAKLLRALDKANPAVIALDFDLRSPDPSRSSSDSGEYADETRDLIDTLIDVSQRRTIVLPRTLDLDESAEYFREPAIYDGLTPNRRRIRTGYIQLPFDLRQVPMPLKLKDGTTEDSFSGAIVRAVDPRSLDIRVEDDKLPYGSFIKKKLFPSYTANQILLARDPGALEEDLGHKIVIVGAAWSQWAYGRGDPIDSYLTPIGTAGGVFMHANYVETLLDSRIYKPLPTASRTGVELVLSLAAAVIFSFKTRPIFRLITVAVVFLFVLLFTYVSWQNFGLFFDIFIPVVLLGSHVVVEQILDWRKAAQRPTLVKSSPENTENYKENSDAQETEIPGPDSAPLRLVPTQGSAAAGAFPRDGAQQAPN